MKKIILTTVICCMAIVTGLNLRPATHREPHSCHFSTCPYKGLTTYEHRHTGADDVVTDDEGSDCDIIDRIHWLHPDWTYDQCEEAMMED